MSADATPGYSHMANHNAVIAMSKCDAAQSQLP